MRNLWLQLADRKKVLVYNSNPTPAYGTMGLGLLGSTNIVFNRKFRWIATLYGPGCPYEAFVKVSARPRLESDDEEINYLKGSSFTPKFPPNQEIMLTFFDEEPKQDFTVVVLTLYDGCGYMLERWLLKTEVKDCTLEFDESISDPQYPSDAAATWVVKLNSNVLRYESFCQTYGVSKEKKNEGFYERLKTEKFVV